MIKFSTGANERSAIVALNGCTFDLDLTDDVQRMLYYRCYESDELQACLALVAEGDCVVDVGANVGAYSVPLARKVGPRGAVHAFEPLTSAAAHLLRNCELSECDSQVTINTIALSDTSGTAEFFKAGEGHSGWGSLERFEDLEPTVTSVSTTTLEEYVASNGLPHIRLVKLDIEGHELSVIAGGRPVLASGTVDYLLIEANEPRLKACGQSTDTLLRVLCSLGFEMRKCWPTLEGSGDDYCGNILLRWSSEPVMAERESGGLSAEPGSLRIPNSGSRR